MRKYKEDIENSSLSSSDNRISTFMLDMIEHTKAKKKLYYLYKNGTRYIVKKKDKGKNSINENKYNYQNNKINYIEKTIHEKFIYKYSKMPKHYSNIIASRLMHNISCHVVAAFKEYLIYGDIYEFLTKYFNKKISTYLLKELIKYYIENNIIYPNYMILPEGAYIFKNIQQKQRIIDNQEEQLKNHNKDKDIDEINFDDNVLTSKVMESILNQTDTSEARQCFGLSNKSINENEDNNKLNLLIENIDKAENLYNQKNIFYKKKLIRITNTKYDNIKSNNFFKMCQYIHKNNPNLYLALKNKDNPNKKELIKNIKKNNNGPALKKTFVSELLSTLSNNRQLNRINNKIHSNEKNKNNNNNLIDSEKRKTIDFNKINIRKNVLLRELKEDNSNSKTSNHSPLNINNPYVVKRPIKESNSLNKRKIYNTNSYNSNSDNNRIYLKKTSKSINKLDVFSYKKYFNLEKYKTDIVMKNSNINNYNTKTNTKKQNNNIISINYKTEEPKEYKKIINNKVNLFKLEFNNNTHNIKKGVSCGNFKSIAKMIKRKYIIDDNNELNSQNNLFNYNSNSYNSRNRIILPGPLSSRNKINRYDSNQITEDDTNSKNIFISNNITNNNYYTIENKPSGRTKKLLNKNIIKDEIIKGKKNRILLKSLNINEKKLNNIYLTTNPNLSSSSYNFRNISENKLSNIKNSIIMNDNSKKMVKTEVISPYKNGLINKTALKSLDKYSLRTLLNKLNDKNSISKDKLLNKNKNKIYLDQINNNKNKTINSKNDMKEENKIRLKRRYLILRDNKNTNGNIKDNSRKYKKINNYDNIKINSRNEHFKTIDSFMDSKIKLANLSVKNNNRNSKIKYFEQ